MGKFLGVSRYKRIIHVWQMLTSIIKIKSITQNILIISHDLNNGLLLFNVVVIIVIVRYKQYRDRYYDTAEKGSKTENWKLMMEGTSLLNFFFYKRSSFVCWMGWRPKSSAKKRLRAFLATLIHFCSTLDAVLWSNHCIQSEPSSTSSFCSSSWYTTIV